MSMTADTPAKHYTGAKRGDLVVIGQTHRDYVIGQGVSERNTFELGTVTGVTRAGIVTRYLCTWGHEVTIRRQPDSVQLVSKAAIDVAAVMAMATAHTWPGHPNQPKAFDTLAEVRRAVTPYLTREQEITS